MKLYKTQYTDLHFERAGLFEVLHDEYPARDVLYPGCSVHVTPSLYFPHVVYVDQSEAAARFFAEEQSLLEFVNRNKRYRSSAYMRFIAQDYAKSLPFKEGKFDLLLSLFAGGIAKSCAKYLKVGGLLLSNNHQNDALDAVNVNLTLKAVIRFQKGHYSIAEELEEKDISIEHPNKKYLRQGNQGAEYIENERYYIFERSHR